MTTIFAIVIREGMTALDVLGPHEILATWPKAQIHTVATQADPIRAASGLVLTPSRTIEQLPSPDVVLVGGGADAYRPFPKNSCARPIRATARSTLAGIDREADLRCADRCPRCCIPSVGH